MTQVPCTPHRRFITPDCNTFDRDHGFRRGRIAASVRDVVKTQKKSNRIGSADLEGIIVGTYSTLDVPFSSWRASGSALTLGSSLLFQRLDICVLKQRLEGLGQGVENIVRELVIFAIRQGRCGVFRCGLRYEP